MQRLNLYHVFDESWQVCIGASHTTLRSPIDQGWAYAWQKKVPTNQGQLDAKQEVVSKYQG